MIKSINEPAVKSRLKEHYQRSNFRIVENTPSSGKISLLFTIFEFLDQTVIMSPSTFVSSLKTDVLSGDVQNLFEIDGRNFSLDFDFFFPQKTDLCAAIQFKNDAELITSWKETDCDLKYEKYAILKLEDFNFIAKRQLPPLVAADFQGTFKNMIRDQSMIAVFEFRPSEPNSNFLSFKAKLNSLDFCNYEAFVWLLKSNNISTCELLKCQSEIDSQHQPVVSVRLLSKLIATEFKSMLRLEQFKIDSNFLLDFIGAIFVWTFIDHEQLSKIVLPALFRLCLKCFWPDASKLTFNIERRLQKIIGVAAEYSKLYVQALEMQFSIEFDKLSLERFFKMKDQVDALKPPIVAKLSPKVKRSVSLCAYIENELFGDGTQLTICHPYFNVLFADSRQYVTDFPRIAQRFENFASIGRETTQYFRLLDTFWQLQTSQVKVQFLDGADSKLLQSLKTLISAYSFGQKMESLTDDQKRLFQTLAIEYSAFLDRKVHHRRSASQLLDFVLYENLKFEKDKGNLIQLEERYTENLRNIHQNKKRQGINSEVLPRFSERRISVGPISGPVSQRIAILNANFKMIVFDKVARTLSSNDLEDERSVNSSGVLHANPSLKLTKTFTASKPHLNGGSLVKPQPNSVKMIVGRGSKTEIDITPRASHKTENDATNQLSNDFKPAQFVNSDGGLFMFGFNNFGQLGFPKEASVKQCS